MAHDKTLMTTLSTNGQVILPKAIRDRREWGAGTRLIVEETTEGVLLKQAPAFSPTRSDEVFAWYPSAAERKP